jgi:hypothetical protein
MAVMGKWRSWACIPYIRLFLSFLISRHKKLLHPYRYFNSSYESHRHHQGITMLSSGYLHISVGWVSCGYHSESAESLRTRKQKTGTGSRAGRPIELMRHEWFVSLGRCWDGHQLLPATRSLEGAPGFHFLLSNRVKRSLRAGHAFLSAPQLADFPNWLSVSESRKTLATGQSAGPYTRDRRKENREKCTGLVQ